MSQPARIPQLERASVDQPRVRAAVREILEAIGENPDREGLQDTPGRVARWWAEFMDYDPGRTAVTFQSDRVDQLVAVSGMRVWSLCEHHLLPFWADVTVAYIARGKVLGLSKLARIAHKHAHRLQLQEQLVDGIATEVAEVAGVEDVAVHATGVHLCMVMRGVRTEGQMVSTGLRGVFRHDPAARAEFLRIAHADR